MTQNEKDLLLKDLCARLPYGVKAYVRNWSKIDRRYYEGVYVVDTVCPSLNNILVTSDTFSVEVIVGYDDYEIKPYLFPMSSISEDQKYDFYCRFIRNDCNFDDFKFYLYNGMWRRKLLTLTSLDYIEAIIDWFHKNNIDYRGLIPMGLANDATGLNIY